MNLNFLTILIGVWAGVVSALLFNTYLDYYPKQKIHTLLVPRYVSEEVRNWCLQPYHDCIVIMDPE